MPDEIIEELWRVKDAIAREHGYDVKRLASDLQTRQPQADVKRALPKQKEDPA